MSDLLLPPRVQAEIQKDKWAQQRAQHRAAIERMIDFDDPVCREWEPVLKRLDPYLRLGRARPQAYEPEFDVRPNFYHWVRDNPTAPLTVEAITGPDGKSFAEPDSGLLQTLESNDLQNPHVYQALIERERNREAAEEAVMEQERQELDQEVIERYVAATRSQVSMTDAPWSQNVAGRKGRKS